MKPPYKECSDCIAKAWCKRYKGEAPVPDTPAWCNPKYRLYKALGLSNIPNRYKEANIYSYKADESNQHIASELKPYLLNITETVNEGKNFLFYGVVPGTGKTFHGTMLLNQYTYKNCLTSKFDFENPLAYFANYADLMDELRYNKNDHELDLIVNKVKAVPLLLLDDIGSGTTSDFTNEQTYLILNYRYNNNLSTVFSTNLRLPDLIRALNPRIVSRMRTNCVEIEFNGKDRRKG